MRLFILAIILMPTLAYSEETVKIASGMSMQEVIKAKGPALQKQEFEASRKIVWHYPSEQVLFFEGRVVSNTNLMTDKQEAPKQIIYKQESTLSREPQKPRAEEVDTLLREIMRESTADSQSPAGTTSVAGSPGINPGFQVAPPLLAPEGSE